MKRRQFLAMAAMAATMPVDDLVRAAEPAAAPPTPPGEGETLYNGITLPAEWPPRLAEPPDGAALPSYLSKPPAVIPIDVGRQLFVDDFLIEATTLNRAFHHPRPHARNPVLRPEAAWEKEGPAPMAMVFSDGVWFDPADKLFKMFYLGGYSRNVCMATSTDGVEWARPVFDVRPGTNVVHPGPRDSATVWLDAKDPDPRRRFKMFRSHQKRGPVGEGVRYYGLTLQFSPDGIHWEEPGHRTGATGDRTTVFYNPFRKRWVYSMRHGWGFPRKRRYWETPDLLKGPMWGEVETAHWWAASDRLDLPRPGYDVTPELYNLDCAAYESIILGLFTIWKGDPRTIKDRPKLNQVFTGFSRNGFHWHRPDREPFIPVSENKGDWNWGNVQSGGGCCCVVGDELYFYHSGRAGAPDGKGNKDGNGSTGLAILRRDGFASMDADGAGGTLTTRPVRFTGQHLFVNVDGAEGELSAEVLDEQGQPLAGWSKEGCVPVRANATRARLTWKAGTLAAVAGRAVRFRFHVKSARLYAFWVAKDESGRSGGYLAAGGPGYGGMRDE